MLSIIDIIIIIDINDNNPSYSASLSDNVFCLFCSWFDADDGREITVPVLLDGEESIMEFIDLPYSGVSHISGRRYLAQPH